MVKLDRINTSDGNDGVTEEVTDNIILHGSNKTDKLTVKNNSGTEIFKVDTVNNNITLTSIDANDIDISGNTYTGPLYANENTYDIGGGGNPYRHIIITGNVGASNANFSKDSDDDDSTTLTLSNYGTKGTHIKFYSNGGTYLGTLTFNENGKFTIDKDLCPNGSINLGESSNRWNIIYSDTLNTTNLTTSGAINCDSVTTTGAVNCGSVSATGAVGCGSVSATGAVGCGSVSATGGVNCASVTASGTVFGDNAEFSGTDNANPIPALVLGNLGTKGVDLNFSAANGNYKGIIGFSESDYFTIDKDLLPSGSINLGSSSSQWANINTKLITIDDTNDSVAVTGLTIKNSGTAGVNFHMISNNGTHSVVWNLSSNGTLSVSSTLVPNGTGLNLGSSGSLWNDVYATSGSVNTSDQNKKQNISNTPLGLDFIDALTPRKFQFIVNQSGRYHHGLISQEVKTVMDAQGISSTDFAGYIHDSDENFYGLRYSEFIAPMIKAIQELKAENEALKARVTALENI